jgi:hypothetical protein
MEVGAKAAGLVTEKKLIQEIVNRSNEEVLVIDWR